MISRVESFTGNDFVKTKSLHTNDLFFAKSLCLASFGSKNNDFMFKNNDFLIAKNDFMIKMVGVCFACFEAKIYDQI